MKFYKLMIMKMTFILLTSVMVITMLLKMMNNFQVRLWGILKFSEEIM